MGANRTHSRVEQNHRPTAIRHRAAGSAAFILWLSYKLSHSAKVWTTHFGDQPRINIFICIPRTNVLCPNSVLEGHGPTHLKVSSLISYFSCVKDSGFPGAGLDTRILWVWNNNGRLNILFWVN